MRVVQEVSTYCVNVPFQRLSLVHLTVSRGQIWVMRFTTVGEMLHDTTLQKNRLERRLEVGKGNNRAGLGVSNRRPDAAAVGLEHASGDPEAEA